MLEKDRMDEFYNRSWKLAEITDDDIQFFNNFKEVPKFPCSIFPFYIDKASLLRLKKIASINLSVKLHKENLL